MSDHVKGTIFCMIGVLCISPNIAFLRTVQKLNIHTIMFFKFAIGTVFMSMFFLAYYKMDSLSQFKKLGLNGIGAAVFLALHNYFFAMAAASGSAADVLVIVGCTSLFSALFSYFLFNEHIKLRTAVTCLVWFIRTICLVVVSLILEGLHWGNLIGLLQ
jgi:drug/metabolite transporter (DMT)-like permease